MAAPLLAELLGGTPFWIYCCGCFATILAVVAGLTLFCSLGMSHDIYVSVFKKGHASEAEQVRVAEVVVIFGIAALPVVYCLKAERGFYGGTRFAIAASGNFPSLLLSILWRKYSTRVRWLPSWLGLFPGDLHCLKPYGMVDVFKYKTAIFPLKNPAIFSMALSFLVGIVFSFLYPSRKLSRSSRRETQSLSRVRRIGIQRGREAPFIYPSTCKKRKSHLA